MGRLSEDDQKNFVELIYYVIKNQEEKAAMYVLKLSKINGDIDINSFKKEMADIISTYFYSSLKQVELKKLIDDMMRVMSRYKIFFKEDNYLLAKALVTMEGIGKKLYPDFNSAEEIKPFILKVYKQNFSVFNILKNSHEINKAIVDFVINAPGNFNEILNKINKGNLKIEFEHVGLESFQKSVENSFDRLSAAIVIASILIGSSMLLSSSIPPVIKGVSLFGIIGYVFAMIIGIILVIMIIRRK
jgi:ubiquinone biosynthesis protein